MDLKLVYSKKRLEDLWQDLKAGDKEAFSLLYDQTIHELLNYASSFNQDSGLIEDCIQELFSDLWLKRENLSEVRSVKAYLVTSLRRRLTRKLKQKNIVYNSNLLPLTTQFQLSIESQMLLEQDQDEIKQKLEAIMQQLPALQKEIIYLKFYGDYNFDEICQMLDINKKSVYNALSKAMIRFRNLYFVMLAIGSFF